MWTMSANNDSKQESARKTRPSAQIYRPPGLRALNNAISSVVEVTRPPNVIKTSPKKEVDQVSNASSVESQGSIKKTPTKPKEQQANRPPAKKTVNRDDIICLVQKLNLSNESMIDDFIEGIEHPEIASRLGHFISRYAIEENKQSQRTCSQLSTLMIECPITGHAFHEGLVNSLNQYFECGEKLRFNHFKVWQSFLNFLNDLYLNMGYRFNGEVVDLIFKAFKYILKLEMKIEELECLIAIFLNIGYELERDCPGELSELKDIIRDTLIVAQEPWARKMLLLLVELGASDFSLSAEANDFYFQS